MNKSLLIALAFLSASALAFAGPKPKKAEPRIDASVKAKSELRSQLQKAGMPVISKWMKAKDKAEPFVVDLKNCNQLILITSGGPDGTGYDHAVWGNARFITADGSSVWLDQIPFEYGVAGWDNPRTNINANGKPTRIAGKPYEHGMFCHANGTLIYPV